MFHGISSRMHAPMGFGIREGLRPSDVRPGGASASASIASLSAQSHLGTELTVVTREGDTITLDWSRDAQVTYSRSTAAVDRDGDGTPDATTTTTSLERSVKTAFSMTVQGDLNEQEMADLRRVVDAVRHALRDFAHGDAEGAAEDIADARTSGSLASVQAEFESSSSLNVVRADARVVIAPPKPPVESLPVGPAPTEGETTPAPTPVQAPPVDADGDTDGDTGNDAGTELVERLRRANEDMRTWLQAGPSTSDSPGNPAPSAEVA